MSGTSKDRILKAMLLSVAAFTMAGCGVIHSTIGGFSGSEKPSSAEETAKSLTVEVRFDSDGQGARSALIRVDSTTSPATFQEDNVPLPLAKQFYVSLSSPFPLRGVSATATADAQASFISCEILVNGKSVDSHRSTGSAARVDCDHRLRFGRP